MPDPFTVRSAAGVLVSLLNPVNTSPTDSLNHDNHSSCSDSSREEAVKKWHKCLECDRAFSSAGHLNRHHVMHTGEKEHVCPFPGCGKTASRNDNLVQHFRVHLARVDHNRCTRYVRSKMEHKMEEVGVSPVQKLRGRKVPCICPPQRSACWTGHAPPLLTPPTRGNDEDPFFYQPSRWASDYSHRLPVSNVREE